MEGLGNDDNVNEDERAKRLRPTGWIVDIIDFEDEPRTWDQITGYDQILNERKWAFEDYEF